MKFSLIFFLLLIPGLVASQVAMEQEPLVFENQQQQDRFNSLTAELRCLVCQNQNLADSDAPLAHDLKKDILEMMQAGNSNNEIKSFLLERYGDFVLYRPPVQGNTLVLWLGPGILLLVGAFVVVFSIRKRGRLLTNNPESE
jgi:cytochrome c-type biogenesis protein CcmH